MCSVFVPFLCPSIICLSRLVHLSACPSVLCPLSCQSLSLLTTPSPSMPPTLVPLVVPVSLSLTTWHASLHRCVCRSFPVAAVGWVSRMAAQAVPRAAASCQCARRRPGWPRLHRVWEPHLPGPPTPSGLCWLLSSLADGTRSGSFPSLSSWDLPLSLLHSAHFLNTPAPSFLTRSWFG